jgi:hypothetical protein
VRCLGIEALAHLVRRIALRAVVFVGRQNGHLGLAAPPANRGRERRAAYNCPDISTRMSRVLTVDGTTEPLRQCSLNLADKPSSHHHLAHGNGAWGTWWSD